MPVIYTALPKTDRMNAVVSRIGTSGKFKLFSAGGLLLASFPLAAAAGTVTGPALTFSDANGGTAGVLNTTALAAGTATAATITTALDVDVVTGLTVGTTGTDVVLDSNVFVLGQPITINSAVINHA